ncbi:MAG: hypothetical protein JSS83_23350 [Cyanobacteria bacterium SZAS LIN-3]|nr:hypothetical protein [Cyanobacteria bacterium SZAS LIN-3]MBS2010565.1 hypothetical protein [Cyanobacteria bacterium SZAS TMP-1]
MEHFIGSLLMPVFVLILLAGIAGVKPDLILKPLLEVVVVIVKLLIETVAVLLRLLGEAAILAIVSRKSDSRFLKNNSLNKPRPQKIKVTVVEDSE